MSAEFVADVLADLIDDREDSEVFGWPIEDARSGGVFFDVEVKGRQYEVLVVETRGGAR